MKMYSLVAILVFLRLQCVTVSEGALTCIVCPNCTAPFKAGQVKTATCHEEEKFCFTYKTFTGSDFNYLRGCTMASGQCPGAEPNDKDCVTCHKDHCNAAHTLGGLLGLTGLAAVLVTLVAAGQNVA